MEVSDYGGKIVKLFTPDRKGKMQDVVVGFDSPAGWDDGDPYWGCIIGRYGNRIADGIFKMGGKTYKLPAINNAPNGIGCNLHGGARGWNAYVWAAEPFVRGTDVGVVFTHVSPDGDEGFPGRVEAKVTYTLTAKNVWRVDYEAVTDQLTPINMTQHVYFNFNRRPRPQDSREELLADGRGADPDRACQAGRGDAVRLHEGDAHR